jgi:hypothetical protein
MIDRVDFHILPAAPEWYGIICGTGDGEAWTTTVYWTSKEWSDNARPIALSFWLS